MIKINTRSSLYFFLSLILLLFVFCEKDPTPTIFVENPTAKPDPVITSVVPQGKTLAGIGEIVFTGQNFSPVVGENTVFFDGVPAKVLAATATQLTVQSPNQPGDSIVVKIDVVGSFLFSNTIYYTLEPAIVEYSDYNEFDDIFGVGVDAQENLYVSALTGTFRRIDKITPDEVRQESYGTMSFPSFARIRVGPGGELFLARGNNTILYRIAASGGNAQPFSALPGRVYDLDFNQDGNIFTAGDGDNLYLVRPDASNKIVADYPSTFAKAVRVYNGYVYVGGNEADMREAVWRNQIITADSLGDNEMVFDLTAELGANIEILSLTFGEDGDMYIGTNDTIAPILIVHPNGSHEPLYPGVLDRETFDMHWGNDVFMYVNRKNENDDIRGLYKLNMQKKGAPYYGRGL
jgi:hypothetical protein